MLRLFPLFLCFGLFSFPRCFAQNPVWEDYDPTFYAGALDMKVPVIARRVLLLDHGHYYGTSIEKIKTQYYDLNDPYGSLYRTAGPEGFRISFNPPEYGELVWGGRAIESYPGGGFEIRLPDFGTRNGTTNWLDIETKLLKYIEIPRTGTDTLIVGKPRFLNPALEAGPAWPYDTLGVPDSSRYARVAFAMWMDRDSLDFYAPNLSDTVAYAVLLRRYTGGQTVCRCAISERFDTLFITRGMYQNGDSINQEGYREVGALYRTDSLSPNPGGYFGPRNDTAGGPCVTYCADLYGTLDPVRYANDMVEQSDFHYEFWSRGVVPIRFQRGAVRKRLYEMVREGQFDDFIEARIDTLASWQPFDTIVWRVGISDEPKWTFDFRPVGLLSAKVDPLLKDAGKPWPLWNNTYQDLQAFRLLTGDLEWDGTTKIVQMFAPQPYGGQPIPVTYANPDSMDQEAFDHYYTDVYYNTLTDYDEYTTRMNNSFGRFRDYELDPNYYTFIGIGGMVRAVDVARFKYAELSPPHPVYQNVQVHGDLAHDANGYTGFLFGRSLPAPNSILCCTWLAMNCGSQGVIFSDFTFDGNLFGPLHIDWFAEQDSTGEYDVEGFLANMYDYAALQHPNKSGSQWLLPRMWVGFKSRFEAIRTAMEGLRAADAIVGWGNLEYRKEQISVHDTTQSFAEIPMLDTALAKQAKRYELDSLGNFVDSTAYDPREETYLEITHFTPTDGDTSAREGSRYYVITSRRIWPGDTLCYETDSVGNCIVRGLGYIDARKPVVRLSNQTSVMADSVLVERVGSSWSVRGTFGSLIELSWHRPGEGALYRVSPIPALISDHGTAWNNAVRSENPSSDATARDRIVVYERDSSVFVRLVDSSGAWSSERMVSSPDDSAVANGKRIASNFFTAVAASRVDNRFTRVVWERRDSAGLYSVESAFIIADPSLNRLTLDSALVVRQSLLTPTTLTGPPNLAPSIVAVQDTGGLGGFVVAWASRDTGVTIMALRDSTIGGDTLATTDSVTITRVYSPDHDSICQYTTLAHVQRADLFHSLASKIAGSMPTGMGGGFRRYPVAHIAYQQGDGVDGLGERIYYHKLGAYFPANARPGLIVPPAEHVTRHISACSFEHPSIAADSVRVAVAFEILENNDWQQNIGLRMRDTIGTVRRWETTLYRWGGPLTRLDSLLWIGSIYERPSVTQFPSMDDEELVVTPEGGLTWFRRDDPTGRAFVQWLYRYGAFSPQEIVPDGKHPTMTLVPSLRENPFEATSILHRTSDSTRARGVNAVGDSVWRYEGRLLNTPGNPIGFFSTINSGSGIVAGVTVAGYPLGCQRHRVMDFGLVFPYDGITHPEDDRHGPGDPLVPPTLPGLPPSFFAPPGDGATFVDTLATAEIVTRTSLFVTGNTPVSVRRIAGGGDSLTEWLNNYGTDPERGVPANVWIVLELVRGSDSAVLWRSDTLDARDLDTLSDPLDDLVGVPVDQAADSGTVAFIRLRGFATAGVVYDLYGGFNFYTEDSTTGGFQKLVRPHIEREVAATAGESALSVQVIPNPARDRAEVRVRVLNPGRVRLAVYNTLGERLADLPDLEANTSGEYKVEISLSSVRAGVYLLRAESGAEESTAGFGVVR